MGRIERVVNSNSTFYRKINVCIFPVNNEMRLTSIPRGKINLKCRGKSIKVVHHSKISIQLDASSADSIA
jgi:hypothetical protein